MSDDKPTMLYKAKGCDYSAFHPSAAGFCVIGFVCEGPIDIALELTPEAISALETRLAQIREAQRRQRGLQ